MIEVKYTNWWAFNKREQSIESALAKMDLYNKTNYCERKDKDEKLLEEVALEAHRNEWVYYVTIYKNDSPFCFLEINKGFYRVCFLDEYARKYLSYDFTDNFVNIKPDKLFLSHVVIWGFDRNTDKVIKTTSYSFNPNGVLRITERNLLTNEQIDREAQNKIDTTANWEDYPEFGEYDKLIQIERGLNNG